MTKLSITQADIDAGVHGDPCHCPIAQALRRAFPGCKVSVSQHLRMATARHKSLFTVKIRTVDGIASARMLDCSSVPLTTEVLCIHSIWSW